MSTSFTKWDDRLALDVALAAEGSGISIADILESHNLTEPDLLDISADPVFERKVAGYREYVRKEGVTFTLKARAQAEEYLTNVYRLVNDKDVSPAVKADLIKSVVKWAGLEPKEKGSTALGGGGVAIQINLGAQGANGANGISLPAVEIKQIEALDDSV